MLKKREFHISKVYSHGKLDSGKLVTSRTAHVGAVLR
jgi:hypothetical protein